MPEPDTEDSTGEDTASSSDNDEPKPEPEKLIPEYVDAVSVIDEMDKGR